MAIGLLFYLYLLFGEYTLIWRFASPDSREVWMEGVGLLAGLKVKLIAVSMFVYRVCISEFIYQGCRYGKSIRFVFANIGCGSGIWLCAGGGQRRLVQGFKGQAERGVEC